MSDPPTTTELLTLVNDLAARLRRVEESQGNAPVVEAKRLTRSQVARVLGCSIPTVNPFAARGLLVRLPKGPTQRTTYYDPANVAALAESEDHARQWVMRGKFVPMGKRPKK